MLFLMARIRLMAEEMSKANAQESACLAVSIQLKLKRNFNVAEVIHDVEVKGCAYTIEMGYTLPH